MTERVFVADILAETVKPGHDIGQIANLTDCMVRIGAKHDVYRQCSIGWHLECSVRDQPGDDCPCMCKCHVDPFYMTVTVGRFALEDSVYTVRLQQGEIDLGWLAPGWIENQDERWITIEPAAIEPLEKLLREARSRITATTGEAG
ncbi:hypothetical protein MARTHA_46 [Arthrobacter phage Martha]|uniref:Uncharacterized protein n=1 Tax=Arthrobacter phage Martha TaxID=1772307 RepID=A0A0U4K912_9CAUD|nr:hypothetical protein FDH49_gp46 [Arthrobacter phage Martha]ALY09699.1 hypothetical protein MARTHA_46 [Arthrobacter phage Martha]